MMRIRQRIGTGVVVAGLALGVGAGAALGAAVTGATVANADYGDYNLTSVTVTRGSAGSITYLPSQLTGVNLTDYSGVSAPIMVSQAGSSVPAAGTRATLIEDNRLDTGVTNPVSYLNPITLSTEITFLKPIVNSSGVDIVVFALRGDTTTRFYINNDKNQYLDVTPSDYSPALVANMSYGRFAYKNPDNNSGTVYNLAELERPVGYFIATTLSADVMAAGIDLSSFGLAEGATITSLRYQAVTSRIQPVMFAGLPVVVPEPAAMGLVGGLLAALSLRTPRH